MATIATLEKDIHELLEEQKATLSPGLLTSLGTNVAMSFQRQLTRNRVPKGRPDKTLYGSELGLVSTCPRKLWYKYNFPLMASALPAHTVMKFTYGDVVEGVVLTLAKAAGHTVEHEQGEVEVSMGGGWKARGRLDAVIDGHLVDVKSTTQWGMKDFKAGNGGNKFGYLAQLSFYHRYGPSTDGKGWLVADKTLGHIAYIPEKRTSDVEHVLEEAVTTVSSSITPVERIDPVPDGTSGNLALSTECSYCDYKKECWKDANSGDGLRAFAYSTGPRFFVKIAKMPNVPEVRVE